MPEQRILKQLVEALLFERVVPWSHGDRAFTFAVGSRVYVCSGKLGAFGRVRITPSSLARSGASTRQTIHWAEIVEALPCSEPSKKRALAEDLENTERLCRWNAEHVVGTGETRREQSYEELEGSLHEGHLYHPCFKSRSGFTVADHQKYGPENAQAFALNWVAVERARLRLALPSAEPEFWQRELGYPGWKELVAAGTRAAAPLDEYAFVPVHPWQWQHLKERPSTRSALERRELVDLELTMGEYRATQSVRTLLPVNAPRRAHVKLPLASRISSRERVLEPEGVAAAPAISSWLRGLANADPFLKGRAEPVLLAEYAGAAYYPSETASELTGHLGFLFRESVGSHLQEGESAVPFNAVLVSENDGRPFIEPWIARFGMTGWLARLLEVSILPVWRLLVHHGVALEAHAQNMLLIHREGWPERIALRDFHDSLEYVPNFVAEPRRVPRFEQIDERFAELDRYYAMSSLEELRELFMDTVFVFNLSELAHALDKHYAFREQQFWGLVDSTLVSYARSKWGDEQREAALGCRRPLVRTESLLRARIEPASTLGHHHWVPNPLHVSTHGEVPCSTSMT